MIRPMPFWPSLPPWANDTPVHVRTSRPRIHHGGGEASLGSVYSFGLRIRNFMTSSSTAEAKKPTIGLNNSAWPTLSAWPQSTPDVAWPAGAISWLARPTPMIEPTRACDDELGMPKAQVPRFQMTAASSSEKIMA